MNGDLIAPLVIPRPPRQSGSPAARASRRRLPLPELPTIRSAATVYGFASVDSRGRVSDKAMPRALGWAPRTRLDIRATQGLLVVRACPDGVFAVTSQGYLGLPAPVRRWCDLRPGDRVFLAAEPAEGRLIVHPPAALDAMVAASHAHLMQEVPA